MRKLFFFACLAFSGGVIAQQPGNFNGVSLEVQTLTGPIESE